MGMDDAYKMINQTLVSLINDLATGIICLRLPESLILP